MDFFRGAGVRHKPLLCPCARGPGIVGLVEQACELGPVALRARDLLFVNPLAPAVTPAKPDSRPSRPQSPAAPSPIISVYHAYIRDKTVWVAVVVAVGAILLVALFLIIKPWNFL